MKPASHPQLAPSSVPSPLEQYFEPFRRQIVGIDQSFEGPYGQRKIIYADWTASGRLYRPIEEKLLNEFGPFVGNTHTETTVTGTSMTRAYHEAKHIIKQHVNAGPEDVLLMVGSGMTGAVSKFQRILGLKAPEQLVPFVEIPEEDRPIVFVTHMEHHSNHTSWLETLADVECILPDDRGLINLGHLAELLGKYRNRKTKIASVTACSNVSGVHTCYRQIARIMHQHDGLCFVDFACSGPYMPIDMHPVNPLEKLDAIYFSPHKFLGGPGTPGILLFDSHLYQNQVPDQPGGGTVMWTNPWGGHQYIDNIEEREDGGTPAFLQTIKAALAIRLKDQMGVDNILRREAEILEILFPALRQIPGLHILADHIEDRLGVISFYIENLHFNLVVKLLNDRFGIQMRGGCSCAGTYGHYLLHIPPEQSHAITSQIDQGDLTVKPGWVRMSIHPTTTNAEVQYMVDSLRELVEKHEEWAVDYRYDSHSNEYHHTSAGTQDEKRVKGWFS